MINYLEQLALKIAYRVAKYLAGMNVTPNQVVLMRFLIAAPLSLYFFSRGKYWYNVLGLIFYIVLAFFDWVDGKLARLTGKSSLVGKLLDDTSDRILVLIVLGSILYAEIISLNSEIWILLAISYYSLWFFLTTILYEFDQLFNLEFKRYPEIEKKMLQKKNLTSFMDKLLYSIMYVHKNSLTKFCFTVSYPLVLGIVLNQLIITFLFILSMMTLRAIVILFLMFAATKKTPTDFVLISILKTYMRESEKKHKLINYISTKEDYLVRDH